MALLLIAALVVAEYPYTRAEPLVSAGTKPTVLYDNCYPNACLRPLISDHWPFGGTPPLGLVAIGSPAFGDYYNLTNQLIYLDLTLNRPQSRWFGRPIIAGNIGSGLRNLTTGIGIGFTALGEFVATLDNGVGGGLALARFNTTTQDLRVTEMWATNRFDYINPSDWVNGWTLSANLTIYDSAQRKYYWIYIHAFAVYSNRTHAGGGRGVAIARTAGNTPPPVYPRANDWRILPFTSADIKPFEIIYDSPRLLVARGGVEKAIDLGVIQSNLTGAVITIRVDYTLVFPKAWPYAIVYYNYSITAEIASKLLPYPMYLNSTAFSIRFEIDQVNGASAAGSYNATIFARQTCDGQDFTLLHATPNDERYRNITMFAAVYPAATEYTPYDLPRLIPYRYNNFRIVLPADTRVRTLAQAGGRSGSIPFVIFQWSSGRLDLESIAGRPVNYRGGVMFVYGFVYNITNWVRSNSPDPYIERLLVRTVFNLPTLVRDGECRAVAQVCGDLFRFKVGVVGSMADPTDVLALAYVAGRINASWFGLDVAPGAFQNLYRSSPTGGMASFINLRNFGGLPVVLAAFNKTQFPYFYDRYNRFAFNATFMVNLLRVAGRVGHYEGGAVVTVGGPFVNMLTRYVQDYAWYAPFINTYRDAPYPFNFTRYYNAKAAYAGSLFTTVWNVDRRFVANNTWPPDTTRITRGYAIVSTAVDPNGTIIMQIWGANAQDTYYVAKLLNNVTNSFTDAPAYVVYLCYDYRFPRPYGAPLVRATVYRLSPISRPVVAGNFALLAYAGDVVFRSVTSPTPVCR